MSGRGTTHDQDSRLKDKTKIQLESTKFPKIFNEKVDFSIVNLDILRPWIDEKIPSYLGFEDEICNEFVMSLLSEHTDPKKMFVELKGFLQEHTFKFMKELWQLIVSAQDTPGGIPRKFLDEAKANLRENQERVRNFEGENDRKQQSPSPERGRRGRLRSPVDERESRYMARDEDYDRYRRDYDRERRRRSRERRSSPRRSSPRRSSPRRHRSRSRERYSRERSRGSSRSRERMYRHRSYSRERYPSRDRYYHERRRNRG